MDTSSIVKGREQWFSCNALLWNCLPRLLSMLHGILVPVLAVIADCVTMRLAVVCC